MRPIEKGGILVQYYGMNFDETIDICIGLDMSGSVGNEQGKDLRKLWVLWTNIKTTKL